MIQKTSKSFSQLFVLFFCTGILSFAQESISLEAAEKNKLEREQWNVLLLEIKEAYNFMADMDTKDMPVKDKINGWENFLNTDAVQFDNPFSNEDDSMRKDIKERIKYWKRFETEILTGLHEASDKQQEMNGKANTQWQKELLANKYLSDAKKYMEKGDYDRAEISFEKLMSLGTELPPDVYYLRSAVQVERGNYEDAVQTLSDYLEKTGRPAYREEYVLLSGEEQEKEAEKRRKEGKLLKEEVANRLEGAKKTLRVYLEQLKQREEIYCEEIEMLSAREKEMPEEETEDDEKKEISVKGEEKNRIEEAKKVLIAYLKQTEQKSKAYQEVMKLLMSSDAN
ncbi:MAG: hypothetical protein E3K37_15000 [Candidatus Kuenenia sp.]|nr:hypothetical protein [Candidatus Kuenenia hertensis]